jgi:hypothetical protein
MKVQRVQRYEKARLITIYYALRIHRINKMYGYEYEYDMNEYITNSR